MAQLNNSTRLKFSIALLVFGLAPAWMIAREFEHLGDMQTVKIERLIEEEVVDVSGRYHSGEVRFVTCEISIEDPGTNEYRLPTRVDQRYTSDAMTFPSHRLHSGGDPERLEGTTHIAAWTGSGWRIPEDIIGPLPILLMVYSATLACVGAYRSKKEEFTPAKKTENELPTGIRAPVYLSLLAVVFVGSLLLLMDDINADHHAHQTALALRDEIAGTLTWLATLTGSLMLLLGIHAALIAAGKRV